MTFLLTKDAVRTKYARPVKKKKQWNLMQVVSVNQKIKRIRVLVYARVD